MVESGNFGFLLRATAEATDVEYIRLHAYDSEDEARRPRLRIWYTAGDQPGDAP
jgi:hypothetical protein